MKYLATTCLLLALGVPLQAQCRGGSCGAGFRGTVVPSYQPAPTWEWKTIQGEPDNLYLFHNGKQVGGYNGAEGYFRPYDAASGTWGPKAEPSARVKQGTCKCGPFCPCKAAELEVVPAAPKPPTGVEWDKIDDPGYRLSGTKVSAQEAFKALQIPEDNKKKRLTVIGEDADCKQVLQDIATNPDLKELTRDVIITSFRPTDWQVSQCGFCCDGKPSIYFQQPPNEKGYGKVLLRLTSYPGPVALAEALRKSDPNYRPNKDPNPLNPPPDEAEKHPLLRPGSSSPPWILLIFGAAAILFIYRSNKQ